MSYLSSAASTLEYGVVQVGGNIDVVDGVISLTQSLYPNANVTFNSITVTGNLTSNGAEVVTSVTPTAGNGIGLSSVVTSGPDTSFTIYNTGVTSLTAGPGISLTANTGNIIISSYGADLINVVGVTSSYTATLNDEYIGVYSASAVTVTLPTGVNGRVYTIKDEYGQGSGKITVLPQAGQTIDGKVNYIISVPNQSIGLVFRSTGWWLI